MSAQLGSRSRCSSALPWARVICTVSGPTCQARSPSQPWLPGGVAPVRAPVRLISSHRYRPTRCLYYSPHRLTLFGRLAATDVVQHRADRRRRRLTGDLEGPPGSGRVTPAAQLAAQRRRAADRTVQQDGEISVGHRWNGSPAPSIIGGADQRRAGANSLKAIALAAIDSGTTTMPMRDR